MIKTIISTRPISDNDYLSKRLQEFGFTVIEFPTIEIVYFQSNPVFEKIFETIEQYSHILFTSKNGVTGFFNMIPKSMIIPSHITFGVIGKSTATELENYGYNADCISKGKTAQDFVEQLKQECIKQDSKILLPVGTKAGTVIEDTFAGICSVDRIEVYKTILPKHFDKTILEIIKDGQFDLVVFTSPSTFENFVTITKVNDLELSNKIACIGTTTAQKVIELGYQPLLIASSASPQIFAQEIAAFLSK